MYIITDIYFECSKIYYNQRITIAIALTVVCSDDIPGGSWNSSCGRESFEFCAWSCDEGKVVGSGPHLILCLVEHWSVNLDVLCTGIMTITQISCHTLVYFSFTVSSDYDIGLYS